MRMFSFQIFNSLRYTPHLDMFALLEILIKIQIDTKIAIKTAAQITKKPKVITNKKRVFIEENVDKFKAGQISRFDFVKRMAFKRQSIGK